LNENDIKAGSHIPILCKAYENGDGDILEMGSGMWSTPILHQLAFRNGNPKRRILTLETDPKWFEVNSKLFESPMHQFKLVEDWETEKLIDETHWGLVLVDHKPALRRKADIIRLKHRAHYILAHDSEPEISQYYKYHWCDKHFRYKYEFKEITPNTTVFSNYSDLGELKWK